MTNTRKLAWALVTATAAATTAGYFASELGLAVASTVFGGSAFAVSLFARRSSARYSRERTLKELQLG